VGRSSEDGNGGVEVSFMKQPTSSEQSIMSAMAQVECGFEILIFDDGSQDNTSGVVTAFQNENPQAPVRLFRNEINRGLAFNFVEGAFHARGRYYPAVPGDNVEPAESIEQNRSFSRHCRYHRSPLRRNRKPAVPSHHHIQALYSAG